MKSIVVFKKREVREYLDGLIMFWRNSRDEEIEDLEEEEKYLKEISKYYIDAYQTVRLSLFGKMLEEGK